MQVFRPLVKFFTFWHAKQMVQVNPTHIESKDSTHTGQIPTPHSSTLESVGGRR